jgi:hypothetical protein
MPIVTDDEKSQPRQVSHLLTPYGKVRVENDEDIDEYFMNLENPQPKGPALSPY